MCILFLFDCILFFGPYTHYDPCIESPLGRTVRFTRGKKVFLYSEYILFACMIIPSPLRAQPDHNVHPLLGNRLYTEKKSVMAYPFLVRVS